MIVPRKTLKDDVCFDGIGLHTGVPVHVTVHPSQNGIIFRIGSERVTASPENVTDTTRSTKLGSVGTIEHMMSALCGLEITDADIELDAPELPGMDGSSQPYVQAFLDTGFQDLPGRESPDLFRRVFFQDGDASIAIGKGSGSWRYRFATGERWPGEQIIEPDDVVDCYAEQIAPSRTFAFTEDIPAVIQAGLGRGLDERSVLVLGMEGYKNDARFDNEPARHKLLDAMGDLYLAGLPARCLAVVAERSGHKANVAAAKMLVESLTGSA
jgi:UDP-3-O-[3-hydroxymyristoyl] N-acetylglucosamine deacetylase